MFGLGKKKNKKKNQKDLKISKKKTLWNDMENIKPTLKTQTAYKNYRIGGGNVTYEDYLKGLR